jgi:hypothetical protein
MKARRTGDDDGDSRYQIAGSCRAEAEAEMRVGFGDRAPIKVRTFEAVEDCG